MRWELISVGFGEALKEVEEKINEEITLLHTMYCYTIYININQNMKSFANEILSLICCKMCTTFLIVFFFSCLVFFSFSFGWLKLRIRSMIAESYYCSPLEVMWKKNEILLSEEEIIKHTHTHTDIYIQMENIIILVIIQLHMNF